MKERISSTKNERVQNGRACPTCGGDATGCPLVTITAFAKSVGAQPQTVRDWLCTKRVELPPSIKIGGRRYFRACGADWLIARSTVAQ